MEIEDRAGRGRRSRGRWRREPGLCKSLIILKKNIVRGGECYR